jgi:hypothetical protein
VVNRSTTRVIPHFPVALDEVALLFGTLVAETILASVHVRTHQQAEHMDASDLIKALQTSCEEGVVHIWKMGRPLTPARSWMVMDAPNCARWRRNRGTLIESAFTYSSHTWLHVLSRSTGRDTIREILD